MLLFLNVELYIISCHRPTEFAITHKSRLLQFQIIFILINLSFIPLISIYGLQVCPVLSIPGFGFGCYYSGIYIFLVNLLNISALLAFKSFESKINRKFPFLNDGFYLFFIYLASTFIALVSLQKMLDFNHLSPDSRAPEILLLASVMLGIVQSYGMTWAGFKISSNKEHKPKTLSQLWIRHALRTVFPFIVVITTILHFMITQAVSLNTQTVTTPNYNELIQQIVYIIIFMVAWLSLVLMFHFSSEKDQVKDIQSHFDSLKALKLDHTTDTTYSWGLWLAITEQLNSFTKILSEKTRLVKSFSKFVTTGVVQQVLQSEITESKGITKVLTVLMIDIRNFTTIAENLTPDQVVTFLNEYFSVMLAVATEFNITVDKFIGDGILAYVDLDDSVSDSVVENRKAVDGSFAMIKALDQLNLKLAKLNLPKINIGVGVYRGPIVLGLIGSEAKLQHTIIGDTVNRTARLESLCKELGTSVVISDHIWTSLTQTTQDHFTLFSNIQIKGIKTPMNVYGAVNSNPAWLK